MTAFELFLYSIIFLLVLEGCWFGSKFARAIRAGKVARPASRLAVDGASVKVLIIGDSMAYGTGATESGKSIVGCLANDFPHLVIDNQAVNSMRLSQLDRKLSAMKESVYDVVFVQIGGVDTLLFTSLRKIEQHLRSVFMQSRRLGATTVIFVSVNNVGSIPLLHFPFRQLFTRRSRKISQLCDQLCAELSVVHVPLFLNAQKSHCILKNNTFLPMTGFILMTKGMRFGIKKLRVLFLRTYKQLKNLILLYNSILRYGHYFSFYYFHVRCQRHNFFGCSTGNSYDCTAVKK